MSATAIETELASIVWEDLDALIPCEAAGHGEDLIRHDDGPARYYVRNLHVCWMRVGDLVAVCERVADWITENHESVGRCPVCGKVSMLEDWAYVVRKIVQ